MPRFILAESDSFDPYFNLSFEKYLFDNVQEGEFVFFLWQNERTVVCGRNQNVYNECNLTSLKGLGGKLARRDSGGGAVFHDHGNLNFSFIARDDLYDVDRQLKVIEDAVAQFGLPATRTGRNDITILGKKFSGSAFHKAHGTNLHHGTIMINVDTLLLQSVLNVSHAKLESNGVESVTSRVLNLNELTGDITVDSMKIALKDAFLHTFKTDRFNDALFVGGKSVVSGTGRTGWTASGSMLAMLQALSNDQKRFQSDEWIYGTKISFTNEFGKKFDWGEITFQFEVKGSNITSARVFSDSLHPNFITRLEYELPGRMYIYEDLGNTVDLVAKSFKSNKDEAEEIKIIANDIKSLISESI